MQNTLNADVREDTGKRAARRLRRAGQIPAICYGSGREGFKVSLDPEALRHLLQHSPKGHNTVIDLVTSANSHHVMVQDIQRDPVKRVPVHVDFRLVGDDDVVLVEVPIRKVGTSLIEELGGHLMTIRRTVTLRCIVKAIPDVVEVDVSNLVIGERIKVSELTAPPGSEVYFKSDFVVLSALRPRGADEEEDEAEDEGDIDEVEEAVEAEG